MAKNVQIKGKKRISKDLWTAIAFLVPSILLILIFVYGFIGWTGYVSLSNYNSIMPDFSFAGLKNYIYLFNDFRFQADLRKKVFFTILFIVFFVIFVFVLSVFMI